MNVISRKINQKSGGNMVRDNGSSNSAIVAIIVLIIVVIGIFFYLGGFGQRGERTERNTVIERDADIINPNSTSP